MFNEFLLYIRQKVSVSDEQFAGLMATASEKMVKKGSLLLQQGDVCSSTFFVASGLLRSYTIDKSGKEHIIQFAPEDWWISDRNSFYFQQPSMFFIDAAEDSKVVYLNHDFFEKAETRLPGFTTFNSMALHNSIRFMQRRVNLLLAATAEERYLDFITLYPNLTLRVPQWMIASYLGITPESLSRVRKELAKRHFKSEAK